jgi:DHA2 family multidrug resistance protein-like MFS transporter
MATTHAPKGTSAAPNRAGIRQWAGLAVLLLPVALMTADLGVLWLATPYLAADLRPSGSELLWATDIYGFMTCGFLVVMGSLGDRIGRRRLLLAGSAGVIVASLFAAYATTPAMLIAARAVLGVAGAAVLPSTLALISQLFADPRQRATAIAMWVTALSAGIAVGPIAGGVLLESFWWGSVFLMGVPVMAVTLVAAPLVLPEYRDPGAGRMDWVSAALFLAAVLPLVHAVKDLAEHGPRGQQALTLVLAVGVGVLFLRRQRRQRRLETPLLDLRLFGHRGFTGALLVLLFGMMALNGVEYLVPQYLLAVSGLTPLTAGLWLLPGAVGLVVGSQVTAPLARRYRPAYVITGGLAVALAGFVVTAHAGTGSGGTWAVSLGLAVVMLGIAPISVLGTALAVGAAPAHKAGSAAATGQTAYDLGLALGIAVTGSVGVAVYRDRLAGLRPAGLSGDALHTAQDTVGAALDTARALPPGLADRLASAAREAFTAGFHATAWASAALAVVTAGLALTLLRRVPPVGREDSQ